MVKNNDIYREGGEGMAIFMKRLRVLLSLLIILGCLACVIPQASASDIADPMRIGVGARSMGMGKAYVGLAEDGDALFLNPAGIARNPNIKITSMYSKLLNEVDYTVLGGVYPNSERSAFGAGYVGSSTGDIILRSATGTSEGTASWGNNVVFVSYATYLNNVFPALGKKDILIGTSLKYYSSGASGNYSSTDSGFGADVSVLVPVLSYVTVGLNAQNVLSTKMSQSGDSIPYCYKVGAKVALIGKENEALSIHSNRKLNLLLDADVERSGTYSHLGLELWPTKNFALRVGSDAGDFTAGAGVRFFGIEFDYAYHPYYNIPENATHYFSLSYLGENAPRTLRVKLDSPADKMVVYEDFVNISGKVEVIGGEEDEDQLPVTLRINEVNIPVAEDLTFKTSIPLQNYGKNLVAINAESGIAREQQEIRIVRLTSFADVPEGYWAKDPIESTCTVGLIKGYPDGSFRPDGELTRAELATLMVRALNLEPKGTATQVFRDVTTNFWAARDIEEAKRLGLIKGYKSDDGYVFRPNNKIKMSEGIAILARFDKLSVPEAVAASPYVDVPSTHWSARYIEAAKQSGMLSYINGNRLGANENMTRAEAVKMLSQTSVAGGMIKDLFTWEKGFKQELKYRPKLKAEAAEVASK